MTDLTWTPDRTAELTRRWLAGESAGYIGRVMGKTRNAVIGKTLRLKLVREQQQPTTRLFERAKPASKPRQRPKKKPRVKSTPKRAQPPVAAPERQYVHFLTQGVDVMELDNPSSPHMCRYIDGDPKQGPVTYCGAETNGGSWCPEHRPVVYQPVVRK